MKYRFFVCLLFVAGVAALALPAQAQTYTMPPNDNYQSGSYRYCYGMYYYSCAMKEISFGGMSYNSDSENNTYFNYGSAITTSYDYTGEPAGAVALGSESFELTMQHKTRSYSGSYSYFFNSVWIDWDRDGQFNNVECVIDPADGWNGGERYLPPHRNSYDTGNYGYYSWRSAPFCIYTSSNRGPVTYTIAVPEGMGENDYRVRCRSWNEHYYKWLYDVYFYRRTRFVEAPYMTSTSLNRNGYYSRGTYYVQSETEDYTLTLYEPLSVTSFSVANLWAGSNLPEYTASASGGVGSYTYSLTDNSADGTGDWVQIDSATGVLSGAAPGDAGGEVVDLTVTVTDEAEATDSFNIVFTVLAPIDFPHNSNFDDPANRPYFAIQGGESSGQFAAGAGVNATTGFEVVSTSNAGWPVIPSVANDPAQWIGATAVNRMSGQEVFFNAEDITLCQISFKYLIENTSNAENAANVGMVVSEDGGATWRAVGGPNASTDGPVYRGDTGGEFIEEEIRFAVSGNQVTLGVRFLGLVRNDASLTRVVIDDFDFQVPLTLQNTFLPNGQQEVPYGPHELTAVGGLGTTVAFAEDTENPLPDGLEIVEDGGKWYIQGVPGAPATGFEENFGITVTDDANGSHTVQYTIVLTAPPEDLVIDTDSTLPTTAIGVETNWQIEALGGLEPLSWSVVSGPSWISIDSETGILTGTPSNVEGPVTVRVMVQDSDGREQYRDSDSRDFVIAFTDKIQIDPTVFPNLPVIQLPNGEAAASYNQGIPLIGGTAPYAWSLAEGSGLPQGMVLGEFEGFPFLTGTPFNEASGSYAFDLVVTDAASYLPTDPEYVEGQNTVGSQSLTLSFRINIGLATSESLSVSTEQGDFPESLFEGDSFELFVTAAGGRPPYSFAGTGVGLPSFVTLTENGRMVIAPQEGDGGNYLMSFEVTDVASGRDVATYQLSIGAPYNEPEIVNDSFLPDAFISSDYGLTFRVEGGNPPYTWTLLGGTDIDEDGMFESGGLPAGLHFNPEAAHLSGIVMVSNSAGTTQIEVQVVDAEGFTATKTFDMAVEPQELPFLEISTSTLEDARLTERYGYTLESTGGYGAHTWTLKPGSSPLPRGLALTEYGVITGTPGIAYSAVPAQFTLQVRDEAGALVEKQFNLTVLDVEEEEELGPTTPPVQQGVEGAGGGCSVTGNSSNWALLIFAGLLGLVALRRRQEA